MNRADELMAEILADVPRAKRDGVRWRLDALRTYLANAPAPKPPPIVGEFVNDAFRELAKRHHPDTGNGNAEKFDRARKARDWLLKELRLQ